MASSTRSAGMLELAAGHRLHLAVEADAFELLDLAVLAEEAAGRHAEIARGALGLARGGAELERPVRPGQRLVLLLRRLRQDLELGHRDRALAERGADAVGAGIAAADHHHLLAVGEDRLDVAQRLAGHAAVLLRQEIHGKVHAASSRPLTARSRGCSAPPASSTAS